MRDDDVLGEDDLDNKDDLDHPYNSRNDRPLRSRLSDREYMHRLLREAIYGGDDHFDSWRSVEHLFSGQVGYKRACKLISFLKMMERS